MNTEIVERLELSLTPDSAGELAAALRPLLESLTPEDRTELVKLLTGAAEILVRAKSSKRPRKR